MLFSSTSGAATTLRLLAKSLHHTFLGRLGLFFGYCSIAIGIMSTKFTDKLPHTGIYFCIFLRRYLAITIGVVIHQ